MLTKWFATMFCFIQRGYNEHKQCHFNISMNAKTTQKVDQ